MRIRSGALVPDGGMGGVRRPELCAVLEEDEPGAQRIGSVVARASEALGEHDAP
jgi:hypothetical protein